MKQLLLFLVLTFVLASCSDKDGNSDSKDSIRNASSIDTSIDITSTKADDYDSEDYYAYSEIRNKPGSITLVTNATTIFSDSLLRYNTGIVLAVGELLTIEKYASTTTKNNWTEPVYKIAYKMGTDIEHGYVSQSYIACRLDTLKSKKIVALTFDYNTLKEKFIGKILLLTQAGEILTNTTVDLDIPKEGNAPYSFTYYFNFEEPENNTGLDGITESFYITAHYDACGYPQITNIFLWNGKKLIVAPESYSVVDADVFSAYSYLVFPSDSLGKQSHVFNIIEVQEAIDSPPNDSEKAYYKKDSTVIVFKWNKTSYTFSKGDTTVKTSRTFVDSNHE